jgi:hypothetical protein
MGDLNVDMADIAKVVLFIAASGSLFGLGLFLFRDQIFSQTGANSEDRKHTGRWRGAKNQQLGEQSQDRRSILF